MALLLLDGRVPLLLHSTAVSRCVLYTTVVPGNTIRKTGSRGIGRSRSRRTLLEAMAGTYRLSVKYSTSKVYYELLFRL